MSYSGYKTKQRELIRDCLQRHRSHSLTADELYEELKKSGNSVGKATIYRCLDILVGEGFVRKFLSHRGESAGYQYVGNHESCTEHFHLKCTECGQLIHLSCDYMKEIDKHILQHHDFYVDNSKTVLYGICAVCKRRQEQQKEQEAYD